MQQKSALLIGASGLTGSHLLQLLLESEAYHTVYAYNRKPLGMVHPKLKEIIIDFDTYQGTVDANTVFCCLGTTIKKAGSKDAFKKVDLGYPVKFAKLQYEVGSQAFLVISAMGVSEKSFIFYNQVKATMEKEISAKGFNSLGIFRPALITGNRKEHRAGEKIAVLVFGWLNKFLKGTLRKYQSIQASEIALGMLNYSNTTTTKKVAIIMSDEIKDLAEGKQPL